MEFQKGKERQDRRNDEFNRDMRVVVEPPGKKNGQIGGCKCGRNLQTAIMTYVARNMGVIELARHGPRLLPVDPHVMVYGRGRKLPKESSAGYDGIIATAYDPPLGVTGRSAVEMLFPADQSVISSPPPVIGRHRSGRHPTPVGSHYLLMLLLLSSSGLIEHGVRFGSGTGGRAGETQRRVSEEVDGSPE